MERITIEEFEEKSNMEIIKSLIKFNNGYITSKQLDDFGIHRMYLKMMKDNGEIERIGRGIYIDADKFEDTFYVLSLELPKVVFSHMTALYFYDLSIKAPVNSFDITVPNNYFNYKIQKHNVFYVYNDVYELGLTEVVTPMGNKVKAYDIERCICDVIRSANRMDLEHVKYSVREYLKRKDKDLNKLSFYADKLGIKEEVDKFITMMYE